MKGLKIPMNKKQNKEIVYKDLITHLLTLPLCLSSTDEKVAKILKRENREDYAYMKCLNFKKPADWKKYLASIRLIEDTENAIMNFFEYQFGDKSKSPDTGEIYLRLYGVLNAVYLQMRAFSIIAELLRFRYWNKIYMTFKNLDIYKLRNIAASHTLNYKFEKEEILTFQISQPDLKRTNRTVTLLDEKGKWYKYDIIKVLTEYENITRDLLIKLVKHTIESTSFYTTENRKRITKDLNEMLPNLIDYSKIDKNKIFNEKPIRKVKGVLKENSKKIKNNSIIFRTPHISPDSHIILNQS